MLVFSSCQKNQGTVYQVNLPDSILYTDVVPDTSVTCVLGWYFDYDHYVPYPSDSSASILLDIDHNNTFDIGVGFNYIG